MSKTDKSELQNQTYTVEEAGQLLGLCRNSAYAAARAGQIPTIRLGIGKLRVPKLALARLLGCISSAANARAFLIASDPTSSHDKKHARADLDVPPWDFSAAKRK